VESGCPVEGAVRRRQKTKGGWGAGQTAAWRRDRFRVLLLCCLSPQISKFPPLKNQCSLVFIGKVLLSFQTSPSTFPILLFSFFFFVNFDFSYFFVFLKTSNINVDSMKKINDFKNNTLKAERVPNVFENLNSFETMLKTMQMY
jgi:hypothetical protein